MSEEEPKVVIYTTRICGYCGAAKRALDQRKIAYSEVNCDDRADLRNWLIDTSGQSTVPQIFVQGQSIGGYMEMANLMKKGEFQTKLDAQVVDIPKLPT